MAPASGPDIPSYRGITWIYGEQGLVPETQPPSNGETEMRDEMYFQQSFTVK